MSNRWLCLTIAVAVACYFGGVWANKITSDRLIAEQQRRLDEYQKGYESLDKRDFEWQVAHITRRPPQLPPKYQPFVGVVAYETPAVN